MVATSSGLSQSGSDSKTRLAQIAAFFLADIWGTLTITSSPSGLSSCGGLRLGNLRDRRSVLVRLDLVVNCDIFDFFPLFTSFLASF